MAGKREERVEGRRAQREGEEPIPAPGVPGTQSTVNQPEANYPEPGTGPKQPGFTQSHEQMLGESNEDFAQRAQETEEEARAQREEAEAQAQSKEDDGEE